MSNTESERNTDCDVVPVYLVEYVDDAEVDVEMEGDHPVVQNHDELRKRPVIRGMRASSAHEYNMDIINPLDTQWRDEFEDIELGDEFDVGAEYV